MKQPKILVVCSNYYKELADNHLSHCISRLDQSDYLYQIEIVEGGTYEIPAVIQHYHKNQPFDGYLALGLLLKGSTDHYELIWQHIKECFIRFTLEELVIGNGIISAPTMSTLVERVTQGERVEEAFNAVDYLIRLKSKLLTA